MATRNIVPRADSEGQVGTSVKKWLKGVFVNLFVSNYITDGTNLFTVAEIKTMLNDYYQVSPEIDIYNLEGV